MPDPPAAGMMPGEIVSGMETNGACSEQFIGEARQQGVGNHPPTGEKGVDMVALWNTLARLRSLSSGIPLNDGDMREVV